MYCIDACYDGDQGIYYCRVYKDRQYLKTYYAKTYEEARAIAEQAFGYHHVIIFDQVIPA